MPPGDEQQYETTATRLGIWYTQRTYLIDQWTALQKGESPETVYSNLVKAAFAQEQDLVKQSLGGVPSVWKIIDDALRDTDTRISGMLSEVYGIDPTRADVQFGWRLTERQREALLPKQPDAKTPPPPPPLQLISGPKGQLFSFNPANGQVTNAGIFPELAKPNMQAQVDRLGRLVAFDLDNPAAPATIIDEHFAFADVDPQIKFEREEERFRQQIAVSRQQVAGQFVGLELQRRGQMVEAWGQDMANQIALGRLSYDEARVNLDRIDSAFARRNEERAVALNYAVARSSLFERDGQLMSRLPGGEQLAEILSAATGQRFTTDDFAISAGFVNPDKAARDVLEASKFTSPIPTLRSDLERTRATISGILGAPIPAVILADTAADQVTKGI